MGKISKALRKYADERREDRGPTQLSPITLRQEDIEALLGYDRKTKHLIPLDKETGEVDHERTDTLRRQGTIQRLLDSKLIYPSGKLTPRGLKECRRLEAEMGHRPIIRPAARDAGAPQRRPASLPDPAPAAEELEDIGWEPHETEQPPADADEPTPRTTPEPGAIAEKPPLAVAMEKEIGLREPSHAEAAAREAVRRTVAAPASPRWDDNAIDPRLVSLHAPNSPEAEQFKILRTNILFPVSGEAPRSILVTSAGPGEGKTFAAANLAISIAMNINKHVLLIDCDLRKPELHRRFGFGRLPGLADYLAGNAPLSSLLVKTKVERLSLLPAGDPPANASELVSSEQMTGLLAEVTSRYRDRLVVIDSPPPRLAAETAALARQVDGVLVVVSHRKTRREEVADLIETVGKEKVLGSLVNFIDPRAGRYYGYGRYGYYGRK